MNVSGPAYIDRVWRIHNRANPNWADPLLDDLARLLTDSRVPDAYAESVRAELREIAYRMRLIAEKEAA